jgi:hypothetical protein
MPLYMLVRPLIVASFLFLLAGCGSGGSSTGNSTTNSTNSSNTSNGIDLSKNYGFNPTVAAAQVNDHVNVYAAWEGIGQRGQLFILFTRSTDGGLTFETPRSLFAAIPEGSHPGLVASGESVYLVWVASQGQGNSEITFSFSNNAGNSFTTPVRVSDLGKRSTNPSIAVTSSQVQIAWLDEGAGDVFFRRSSIFGIDFEPAFDNLNTALNLFQNGTAIEHPSLAAEGANIYVVWQDLLSRTNDPTASQAADVSFVKSTDSGQSFSPNPPQNLSVNLTNSTHPIAAAVGDNVYILWEDFSSNNSSILAFRRSSDRGITFPIQNNREIQLSGVTATGPRMAADGNHIFIVWDNPSPNVNPDQEGSLQILFARSDDQGNRFGIPLNISQNPISAKNPAIAAADAQAFVVWEGQQDSQQKIFFYKPQIN